MSAEHWPRFTIIGGPSLSSAPAIVRVILPSFRSLVSEDGVTKEVPVFERGHCHIVPLADEEEDVLMTFGQEKGAIGVLLPSSLVPDFIAPK
eukprot:g29719.t1